MRTQIAVSNARESPSKERMTTTASSKKRWNSAPWAGFLITIGAFLSYFLLFARFPVTRDVPWVNALLFVAGATLVAVGLRRAFRRNSDYGGRIAAPILAVLSLLVIGLFGVFLYAGRQLPKSGEAPRAGQQAPEFSLADVATGRTVSLSELLSAPVGGRPPRGVVLVFYRGYW
jgi:hypothetical protein